NLQHLGTLGHPSPPARTYASSNGTILARCPSLTSPARTNARRIINNLRRYPLPLFSNLKFPISNRPPNPHLRNISAQILATLTQPAPSDVMGTQAPPPRPR